MPESPLDYLLRTGDTCPHCGWYPRDHDEIPDVGSGCEALRSVF